MPGVQSVRRSLEIVRTVAQMQRSGASLTRIASGTSLSVPTTYRLLRTLTDERLIVFNDSARTYQIGPLAFELGLATYPELRVQANWAHVIADVARRTRLTSCFMARSDNEAVCLDCAQGAAAIRAMPMEIGQRVPLGIGAGSLAILASLGDDEVRAIVSLHLGRYGLFPGGDQDEATILQRVRQTRRAGFSISSGTVAKGVIGIGVLIPKGRASAVSAITVSAVASVFDPREAKSIAASILRSIETLDVPPKP